MTTLIECNLGGGRSTASEDCVLSTISQSQHRPPRHDGVMILQDSSYTVASAPDLVLTFVMVEESDTTNKAAHTSNTTPRMRLLLVQNGLLL